jgi:hypothetical protein
MRGAASSGFSSGGFAAYSDRSNVRDPATAALKLALA